MGETTGIIEMDNPQGHLLEQLTLRDITQTRVAITYALLIRQQGSNAGDWSRVNAAIVSRWKGKSALMRIKKMAWKLVDGWREMDERRNNLAL